MNNPKKDKYGTLRWYNEKAQLHREGEPAIEWGDGSKEWFINGKRHRKNGPAVKYTDGYKEWWENGKFVKDENEQT